MSYQANVFRIFIASSNDLADERRIIRDTIREWNDVHGFRNNVHLEPVLYQSHIWYDSTQSAQAIINQELLDSCDLMIALFWKRVGTPTGKAAGGTLEELERFSQSRRPVLLCFKEGGLSHDDVTQYSDDLKIIANLKADYANRLTLTFSQSAELRAPISRQIRFFGDDFIKAARAKEGFAKKGIARAESSYDALEDLNRLVLQSQAGQRGDRRLLDLAIERISEGTDSIRVLDFGCGSGVTTVDRFKDIDSVRQVIGLDIKPDVIALANSHLSEHSKFQFIAGEVESMSTVLGSFDLIFITYVLSHLRNPQATLNTLWRMVAPGGGLVMRTVDEGLELTYPMSRDLEFMIDVNSKLRGASDRTVGRQTYSLLYKLQPSPADIVIEPDPLVMASRNQEARHSFFKVHHSWRPMYAKQLSIDEGGIGPNTEIFKQLALASQREEKRFIEDDSLCSMAVHITAAAFKQQL